MLKLTTDLAMAMFFVNDLRKLYGTCHYNY